MTWVSLQMISISSLLFFNHRTSCLPAGGSRCVSEHEFNSRADKFRRNYWVKLSVSRILPNGGDPGSCEQAARELSRDLKLRSVSPWTYRTDRDVDRFPREIPFAECLCQGCIINQSEVLSYNSVPVFTSLMVLKKSRCPRDPNKYVVKKDFIKVPVACACAVPKYAASQA